MFNSNNNSGSGRKLYDSSKNATIEGTINASIIATENRTGTTFEQTKASVYAPLQKLETYLDDFLVFLRDVDATAFEKILKDYRYEGFNIDLLIDSVALAMASRKKSGLSNGQIKEELNTLLAIGMTRGSKLTQIHLKTPEDMKANVLALFKNWGLVETGKTLSPSSLTLPRLVSLFPQKCAKVMKTNKINPLGTVPEGLPNWLCFPSGASLIPAGPMGDELFKSWKEWQISFDAQIHAKDRKMTSPSVLASFAEQIRASAVLGDSGRIAVLKDLTS